jgi:cell division protein FtsW
MGNGAGMSVSRDMTTARKKSQSAWRSPRLGLDIWLIIVVFTLLVFGLLMVYSASTDYSMVVLGEEPSYMFKRQVIFALIGIAVAAFLAWFDYHRF